MTEKTNDYKYIFGPVTSRRLGISLGIDLIPLKTCTLDCIYCECGKTTENSLSIKEHVPHNELMDELSSYLSKDSKLDAVTFAGSGEPTLYSRIDEVIDYLKKNHPEFRVVLLTNSTLFNDSKVRKRVMNSDTIIASFDAGTDEAFRKINRPASKLSLGRIKEGLLKLKEEYKNELIIEIFIVPGINDSSYELSKIRDFVNDLSPDGIQINSLDRPGTCDWVPVLTKDRKDEIEEYFGIEKTLEKELRKSEKAIITDIKSTIIQTVKRRPCTESDLKKITGRDKEVEEELKELTENNELEIKKMPRGNFYYLKKRK